jgi:mitogen-activated protein kinase kinase
MADSSFKIKTMKRGKNVKGLALMAPPPKPAPSAGDAQIPGALGNEEGRNDTLEIGIEFRLDLKAEDLIVIRELGAGNGGTVSKVQHAATKVIMARKVRCGQTQAHRGNRTDVCPDHTRRSQE